MNVSEVMTRGAACINGNATMAEAAALMWEHDCGCVPILRGDGGVMGMITDRDICMAALTQGQRLQEMSVLSAATTDVATVRDTDDVETAMRLMDRRQVRRLPVVDGSSRVVGVVSINDLARVAQRRGLQPAPAPERVAGTLAAVGRSPEGMRANAS
ncbi:MAG: CBS domain-containing protein [Polyangiaceae bacterium]|nr:CBS domain-containing protein [Polyangiaceae bacterium]